MAGLAGIEQRHRDRAGVERTEMRDEVVEALRGQDGDTVARLGHLLQAGRDGAVARAELRPGDVDVGTFALCREVEEPVGQAVALRLRPTLDVANDAPVLGELDVARRVEERVVERHVCFSPMTAHDARFAGLRHSRARVIANVKSSMILPRGDRVLRQLRRPFATRLSVSVSQPKSLNLTNGL